MKPGTLPMFTNKERVRFWSKVDRLSPDECWPWLGYVGANGYGQFTLRHRSTLAHRVAYTLAVGPIPDGLTLDHLCRVRDCVNSWHLEPTTLWENTRRGNAISALLVRQTHCKRGHPFDAENTYHRPDNLRSRMCRECGREAWRRWYHRRAA